MYSLTCLRVQHYGFEFEVLVTVVPRRVLPSDSVDVILGQNVCLWFIPLLLIFQVFPQLFEVHVEGQFPKYKDGKEIPRPWGEISLLEYGCPLTGESGDLLHDLVDNPQPRE